MSNYEHFLVLEEILNIHIFTTAYLVDSWLSESELENILVPSCTLCHHDTEADGTWALLATSPVGSMCLCFSSQRLNSVLWASDMKQSEKNTQVLVSPVSL